MDIQRRGNVAVDDVAANLTDYVVVDIRDRSEWSAGHIPAAIHLTPDVLAAGWTADDARLPFAVFCDDGTRAPGVAEQLIRDGFDAVTIVGGAAAWRQRRHCLVTNRN